MKNESIPSHQDMPLSSVESETDPEMREMLEQINRLEQAATASGALADDYKEMAQIRRGGRKTMTPEESERYDKIVADAKQKLDEAGYMIGWFGRLKKKKIK